MAPPSEPIDCSSCPSSRSSLSSLTRMMPSGVGWLFLWDHLFWMCGHESGVAASVSTLTSLFLSPFEKIWTRNGASPMFFTICSKEQVQLGFNYSNHWSIEQFRTNLKKKNMSLTNLCDRVLDPLFQIFVGDWIPFLLLSIPPVLILHGWETVK